MAPSAEKKLTGLVAATFTPFTPQGEVNLAEIGPYIDYLTEKQGVHSIFVNGTTGESMSLTVAERKILAEDWCQKARGKLDQVIVHVGCLSLKDAKELAGHAAQIGADAIAVMAPFFFKPRTADALRSFLQEVASAAPNLPFYYYHIPAVTGVNVPVKDVLEGIEELIPSFRGVKFSGSDLMDFGQCVSDSPPHWSFLYGMDEVGPGSIFPLIDSCLSGKKSYDSDLHSLSFHSNCLQLWRWGPMERSGGFDVGVNKQLMIELSGLSLGPPRLPVTPCPFSHALLIVKKYHHVFTDC
ncbi:N-acetylneuraminate lyase [Liparis tanakae]|uniref:N-acetylneuraminate lyase n=1 Tax=Liparis tanakae TaxID=230148 RepID=A0A4Z2GKR7_9TELE|nr:N-acetylneuraminate lyase [Liparis tanakae]